MNNHWVQMPNKGHNFICLCYKELHGNILSCNLTDLEQLEFALAKKGLKRFQESEAYGLVYIC
jgi:hypothetical protein